MLKETNRPSDAPIRSAYMKTCAVFTTYVPCKTNGETLSGVLPRKSHPRCSVWVWDSTSSESPGALGPVTSLASPLEADCGARCCQVEWSKWENRPTFPEFSDGSGPPASGAVPANKGRTPLPFLNLDAAGTSLGSARHCYVEAHNFWLECAVYTVPAEQPRSQYYT